MSSDDSKPADVVWHDGHVQTEDRSQLLGQRPITVWLTGLSASGKSTLAFALERRLVEIGHACYALDGDNVRHGLNAIEMTIDNCYLSFYSCIDDPEF